MAKQVCSLHSGFEKSIETLETDSSDNKTAHERIHRRIDERVTNKYFLLLVVLVIGGLGFQWGVYEKINSVEKKVAVIEAKITNKKR